MGGSVTNSLRLRAEDFFRKLQNEITSTLEVLDGGGEKFFQESWQRRGGGGGRTRVFAEGGIFEKAGVNFSSVHGAVDTSDPDSLQFYATGVSLVLHPHSPMIPTVHANFRYLEYSNGDAWFGGGVDLTPYYLDVEDATHFHSTLKAACDRHSPEYYPKFKAWCDEYFYIKHRDERRGIGGIFFDHLRGSPHELEEIFTFVQDAGSAFLPAYVPIVERHRGERYTEADRHWQLLRRGRYVEFNLVYDRGTKFGLETDGRIESILMSLPALARWEYNVQPAPGSREEILVSVLREPREWALPLRVR